MFKILRYSHYVAEGHFIFVLEDSDFICELSLCNFATVTQLATIIVEYQKRKLPIVQNVVLWYKKVGCRYNVKYDQIELDKTYPKLNYGSKYYQCILKQLQLDNYK